MFYFIARKFSNFMILRFLKKLLEDFVTSWFCGLAWKQYFASFQFQYLVKSLCFLCTSLQLFRNFSEKMRPRRIATLLKGHLEMTILAAWYRHRHQHHIWTLSFTQFKSPSELKVGSTYCLFLSTLFSVKLITVDEKWLVKISRRKFSKILIHQRSILQKPPSKISMEFVF